MTKMNRNDSKDKNMTNVDTMAHFNSVDPSHKAENPKPNPFDMVENFYAEMKKYGCDKKQTRQLVENMSQEAQEVSGALLRELNDFLDRTLEERND